MAPSSRTPPLLQPFVRTPADDALLLLTSTVDASGNWLLGRFLSEALAHGHNAVLVSWMRDHDFWRQELRKAAALDLAGLRAQGRFAYVDGLSALFLPAEGSDEAAATATSERGLYTLSSASPDTARATVAAALAGLGPARTLVVLDNPDVLLAAAPRVAPSQLAALFLALHALPAVSHVLVHLQSDLALLAPSAPPQPLQIAHQNLLVKTAHMSARVLALRVLDTGVARDVSGVLRATAHRDSWANIGSSTDGEGAPPEEPGAELLYKVHRDGSVRVFERGAETAA